MSLRPVDMQVLIPKIDEVAKSHQIQNQHEEFQQQQFAAQLQKQAELQQKQVTNSPKSEGGKIKKEKEKEKYRQQSGDGKKQRYNAQEEDSPQDFKEPNKGNLLDIKV
ncbi:hypothetical protein [Thermincola potens]|uniref:Uncharacterized protein n=1 Tax=Thermincola potens (strain JR) TaxID=635013 RepID=D5XFE2_THEPJ|nr:hypothetical protein [Thermincola potens]ADG82363.1 conserved hypothetical protein [Thermincola potens JR]